jgi:hypothetical protein
MPWSSQNPFLVARPPLPYTSVSGSFHQNDQQLDFIITQGGTLKVGIPIAMQRD